MNWMQAVMDAKKAGAVYPGDHQQGGTNMRKQELIEKIADEGPVHIWSVDQVIAAVQRQGWLHDPDQVPGRTITESEVDLAVAEVFGSDWRAEGPCKVLLGRLGLTVVPDPELPTEPGSVVRTRGDGEDYTLGRDLNWRYGRSVVQPADLRQLDWEVVA